MTATVRALPTPSASITSEWLEEWATTLRHSVRPNSATVYLRSVRQFLAFLDERHPGVTTVAEVKREHVEGWMAHLTEQGMAPATRSVRLKALSRFFTYVDEQEGTGNPVDKVARPTVHAPRVEIPPDEVITGLLTLTDGKGYVDRRDHALIRLLADAGLRRSEAIGLDVDDVDTGRQLVLVRHGKGGKVRVAAISGKTAVALSRYLRARRSYASEGEVALFLSTRTRQRLTSGAVALILKRRCAELGIPPIHPHQLRHAATHALLRAGLGEQMVEHQMGWSGGQMIRRYASALAAERSQEAIRAAAVGDRL